MSRHIFIATLLALMLASSSVLAAGSTSSSTQTKRPSNYDKAVIAVNAGDYPRALGLLEKVVARDSNNADAWNYIGFSHRKLSHYDEALSAYEKALAIDPKHRGALEYLGELYLRMGDLSKAQEQLEKLDRACYFGCEEADELKAAIAKHKQG